MTIENITAGFRVTGVYPFDKTAATATVQSSLIKESFLGRKVSFAYVLLITPTPSRQSKHHEVTSHRQMRKESCNKSFEDSNALVEAGNFSRHEATSFSIGEERLFRERHENGYDLTHDQKYNKWLKENELQTPGRLPSLKLQGKAVPHHDRLLDCSRLPTLLQIPSLPHKPKLPVSRSVDARVLTSAENIQLLEEKAKKCENESAESLL